MRGRWLRVAALVGAVVAVGVLARVDPGDPRSLPGAQESPEPSPGATPEDAGAAWERAGAWRPLANSPGGPRRGHTAVWTGPCTQDGAPGAGCGQLLIWGGLKVVGPRSDGAAYAPATDSWTRIPPAPREPLEWGAVPGVWTGADPGDPGQPPRPGGEFVLWGPTDADFASAPAAPGATRGVAYDPVAGSWRTLPEAPIAPRFGHTLTWSGQEVIVWGGQPAGADGRGVPLTDGAAYDPAADAWRPLPGAPLAGRRDHVAAWLPETRRFVVWGGVGRDLANALLPLTDGAAYDPATGTWEPLPAPVVSTAGLSGGWQPAAASLSDPERLVVVAPLHEPGTASPVIGSYDPVTRRWQLLPAEPVGARRGAHVGGGDQLVVWGGAAAEPVPAGAIHDPRTGTGRAAPDGREPAPGESATWTGRVLLTWGGGGREGALWDPGARPGDTQPHAAPHEPGEERFAELPAGHETGWRLRTAGGETTRVEVGGASAGVEVWLEARSPGGARIRRFPPATTSCTVEGCAHRFDPLPEPLPGPVDVRLRNTGAGLVAVGVTPT